MELNAHDEGEEVLDVDVNPKVDLNHASIEMLSTLPGIGEQMAQRIVEFRETQGLFTSPEMLTEVPGIGSATYEQLADQLVVGLPEGNSEAAMLSEVFPETLPPFEDEVSHPYTEEPPEVQEELEAEDRSFSSDEETAPQPVPAPKVSPQAPTAPKKEKSREESPARQLPWILVALIGGLFGMLFSLIVLSGINGSLDINNSRSVVAIRGQLSDVAARLDSLEGEVDGLRQRLDVLEGLTARMDKAETAVADLQDDLEILTGETEALSEEVDMISDDLEVVRTETEKARSFFDGLQDLLEKIFGASVSASDVTPTPSE